MSAMLALGVGAGAHLAYAERGSDHDIDDLTEASDAADHIDMSGSSGGSDDHDVADSSDSHGGPDDDHDVADNSDSHGGPDDHDVAAINNSGSDGNDGYDSSGSNSGSDGSDGDYADNSGSNSGSGSDGEYSDNSGSNSGSGGSGGDDADNSGSNSGSGGSSGSNSGSGSGDDNEDSNSGSGSNSGSNSGSSGSGSGDDDNHSGSNSGNSGPGSNSGSGSELAVASTLGPQLVTIELSEHGEERAAGEALLAGDNDDIAAAEAAGFVAISTSPLPSMDCTLARLALPNGMSVEQGIAALQALAPTAVVSANNLYRSSQARIEHVSAVSTPTLPLIGFQGVVGIIDTGVRADALAEPDALLSQRAFASLAPAPQEHGAAVAALAVSRGVRVHVADVFGPTANGSMVASAESIAAALDWLVQNNVSVINVSIEGPNNPTLRALVARASARGYVVVAAAGNGGPMAEPAFPAAFDNSVAVTAIDQSDRPYIRANRGGYIDFAARGVNVNVNAGNETLVVSGTSFSAPLVAAHIARRLGAPSQQRAEAVLAELRAEAVDLGAPGHDPIFGWGAVRP